MALLPFSFYSMFVHVGGNISDNIFPVKILWMAVNINDILYYIYISFQMTSSATNPKAHFEKW